LSQRKLHYNQYHCQLFHHILSTIFNIHHFHFRFKIKIIEEKNPKTTSFQFVTTSRDVSACNNMPPATDTFKLSIPLVPGIVIVFVIKFPADSLIP